jgi:hypothetical protein
MRYIPFAIWVGITLWFLVMSVSSYYFGDGGVRLLAKRIGLSFVWPLAMLSREGRNIILSYGRKL